MLTETARIKQNRAENAKPSQFSRVFLEVPGGLRRDKEILEAITAFLEGRSFEDVIRTAVSLGGDCDTLTCIADSIAEAFYGVPEDLKEECRRRIPEEFVSVIEKVYEIAEAGGV